MATLGAEILTRKRALVDELEVPEWGGTMRLRALPARVAVEIMEFARDQPASPQASLDGMARVIAASWVNDEGGLVLDMHDQAALDALLEQDLGVLKRISEHVLQMNGLMPDAAERAEKN